MGDDFLNGADRQDGEDPILTHSSKLWWNQETRKKRSEEGCRKWRRKEAREEEARDEEVTLSEGGTGRGWRQQQHWAPKGPCSRGDSCNSKHDVNHKGTALKKIPF